MNFWTMNAGVGKAFANGTDTFEQTFDGGIRKTFRIEKGRAEENICRWVNGRAEKRKN